MKTKCNLVKAFLVVLVGIVAMNLSFSAMNEAVIHPEIEKNSISCFPSQSYQAPNVVGSVLGTSNTTSNLLGYLFQLMFILFFISPPMIAFMLFLIWKELKERNRMK